MPYSHAVKSEVVTNISIKEFQILFSEKDIFPRPQWNILSVYYHEKRMLIICYSH